MAKEIKRRLFSSRKVIAVLLALILLGAAGLAMTVFAQGEATLTVGSGQGYTGGKVTIPVTITNRSGATGVEFRLYYDGSLVDIPMIEDPYDEGKFYPDVTLGALGVIYHPQGSPLLESALHSDDDGDYISIAIAGNRKIIGDGALCTCLLYTSRCV